jgi:poly-gamma-glutamate system protein
VVLTSGLAVLALGGAALPHWLAPKSLPVKADGGPAAAEAERLWRGAVEDIARARGVAPDEALIGSELTPLVTTLGEIEAKRVSALPAWSRVLVAEFHRAGIVEGDVVAASFSGSFPGLNLSVMAACQALGIRLAAVSSVTASSFGASDAGFTWPEMEARLVRDGKLRPASVAISAGGDGDAALGLDEDGQALAREIAERTARQLGARLIGPSTFDDGIRRRFEAYDAARKGRRLAAFINVGGTEASLGLSPAILRLRSGWLDRAAFDTSPGRGLVARMVERGIPVLHLLNLRDLAVRWRVL